MRIRSNLAVASAVAVALLANSHPSAAALEIGVSVNIAPPELPVYEQPDIPGPDFIWTPGYWAWSDDGYYWVPGTWVEAPQPGLLWTPGYWGWEDSGYRWHGGYWGPEIGFYGGVNYGFGYFGHGYQGGYWDHGAFRYNGAYNNIRGNRHITNVYTRTVVNNITINHISYNGGNGGVRARPDEHEMQAERGQHVSPVEAQIHHREAAQGNPDLRANFNHGHPPIAATPHAGEFSGQGIVPAHGAPAMHVQPEQHGQGQIPGRQISAPSQGEREHFTPGTPTSPQHNNPVPQPPPQAERQFEHAPQQQPQVQHNNPQFEHPQPIQHVPQPPPQQERQFEHAPQQQPQVQHVPQPPPQQERQFEHAPQQQPQIQRVPQPPPQQERQFERAPQPQVQRAPAPPPPQQAVHPQPQQGHAPPRENEHDARNER